MAANRLSKSKRINVALFALSACVNASNAATPEELSKWAGCYDITLSKNGAQAEDSSNSIVHVRARLTSDRVPFTGGAYVVRALAEDSQYLELAQWWPSEGESLFLSLSSGFTGWSMTLKSNGSVLEGKADWDSDSGQHDSGWKVLAEQIPCK